MSGSSRERRLKRLERAQKPPGEEIRLVVNWEPAEEQKELEPGVIFIEWVEEWQVRIKKDA